MNFFLVRILITVFADLFIIAICVNSDDVYRQIVLWQIDFYRPILRHRVLFSISHCDNTVLQRLPTDYYFLYASVFPVCHLISLMFVVSN